MEAVIDRILLVGGVQPKYSMELASRVKGVHIIKPGETLELIAGVYHMSVEDLRKINRDQWPSGSPSVVRPGTKLIVYEPSARERRFSISPLETTPAIVA